jgi:hypothetical protein
MAKQRAKTTDLSDVSDEHDVGIDPHKKTLTATVQDGRGGTVATASFKVSGVGHRALEEWATSFGPVRRWGIENVSGLGRHTVIFLVEEGRDVRDVCPTRTAEQSRRRRQGKADALDSLRIAREVQADHGAAGGVNGRRVMPALTRRTSCSICGTTSGAGWSRAVSICSMRPTRCCTNCRGDPRRPCRRHRHPSAAQGARRP